MDNLALKEILTELQSQIYDILLVVEDLHNTYNDLQKQLNAGHLGLAKELFKERSKEDIDIFLTMLEAKFKLYDKKTDEIMEENKAKFKNRIDFMQKNLKKIKSLA